MRRPLDELTRAALVVGAAQRIPTGPWEALLLAGEAYAYDYRPLLVHDPRRGRALAEQAGGELVRRSRILHPPPDAAPGFFISRLRALARQWQDELFSRGSALNSVELTVAELRALPQAIRAAWAAGDAQAGGLLQAIDDCYAKYARASAEDLGAEDFVEGLLEHEVVPYFKQWRVGTPWARPLRPHRLRVMGAATSSERIAPDHVAAMFHAAKEAGDELATAVLAAFHHSLRAEGQHLSFDEIPALADVTPGFLLAVLDGAPRWFSADWGWTRPLSW